MQSRTKEMLQEELEKQKQAKELKALEEAISASQAPPPSRSAKERAGKSAGAPSDASDPSAEGGNGGDGSSSSGSGEDTSSWAAAVATAPVKLEGAGRSHNIKPYFANLTDFVAEGEACRQVRELQAESELLRKCLADSKQPRAFESYLKMSKGTRSAVPF